ncbi:DUF2934 domain-containing protein [Paracoccus aerius]
MDADQEDRIRQRAHQLWEEQGRPEGMHDQHWEQARSEMGAGAAMTRRRRRACRKIRPRATATRSDRNWPAASMTTWKTIRTRADP